MKISQIKNHLILWKSAALFYSQNYFKFFIGILLNKGLGFLSEDFEFAALFE